MEHAAFPVVHGHGHRLVLAGAVHVGVLVRFGVARREHRDRHVVHVLHGVIPFVRLAEIAEPGRDGMFPVAEDDPPLHVFTVTADAPAIIESAHLLERRPTLERVVGSVVDHQALAAGDKLFEVAAGGLAPHRAVVVVEDEPVGGQRLRVLERLARFRGDVDGETARLVHQVRDEGGGVFPVMVVRAREDQRLDRFHRGVLSLVPCERYGSSL